MSKLDPSFRPSQPYLQVFGFMKLQSRSLFFPVKYETENEMRAGIWNIDHCMSHHLNSS